MKDENRTPSEPEVLFEVEEPGPERPGEPPSPPPEAATPPAAPPTPEERIAALEKEKQETYDRLLRTAADFDNFRKRSRKDVEDARNRAREEVLKEMLGVVDNLERALGAVTPGTGEALAEGVRLVLRQFQSALERFQVRAFDSVGKPFDPTLHEAISQIETTEHEPGTVHAELQKGYLVGDRLLRPALVAVAKAPAGAGGETGGAPAGQPDSSPTGA